MTQSYERRQVVAEEHLRGFDDAAELLRTLVRGGLLVRHMFFV